MKKTVIVRLIRIITPAACSWVRAGEREQVIFDFGPQFDTAGVDARDVKLSRVAGVLQIAGGPA